MSDSPEDPTSAEAELDPPPEPIQELVLSCLQYVRAAVGVPLDFTPETLPLLDHYARKVQATVSERPEVVPLVARSLGAYFGEVVRAGLGGFWLLPSTNVHDYQVCLRSAFVSLNPVGVAYDALFLGENHDGPSSRFRLSPEERPMVEQRLSTLPEVPEDEFYSFSTRYEALQIAAEALRSHMEATGYSEQTFDESDYAVEQSGLLLS